MPTITDNLNLFKPDPGQSGVASELNSNWDQLDFRFDEAGGHTHDGTPGQGPKVPVTSLATTGTPSETTYLRGDGLWTTGTGGGGGVTDHGALTGLTDDDHPQYANQSRGDARYAQKANNLSDLANTATARTNIGAAAAVHQHAGTDITTGTVPTARLGSGTPSTSTFLRGDQTWAVPGAGGMVNLDDLADVLITSPADNQVLSYDAAGARWINEAPSGGGGGAVATDAIWDAAGDLAVGSGANTAVALPKGNQGDYLTVNAAGQLAWALGGGATASRPTSPNRVLYHRYFDTTLGKLIAWDGTNWRDGAGADMGGDAVPIITTGLIFGYAFSEGTGQTLNDLGPDNRDGQLGSTAGADANDPDWVTAGLDFVPGTADVVITPSGFPDTGWLGAITVMVVAKVDTGSAYRDFISKNANSTGQIPIEFITNNDATPKLLIARGHTAGNWKQFLGPNVSVGSYAAYSVVCSTGEITTAPTFYVNTTATAGTAGAAAGSAGTATGSSAAVRIGRRADAATQMDGVISYLLVYSRALSAGEIATNYSALQAIMAGRGVTLP